MAGRDFSETDALFRERLNAEAARVEALLASEAIGKSERADLELLRRIAEHGLAAVVKRRPKSASEIEVLVAAFLEGGPAAALRVGSQRGGDFLNNQLRGRWAEDVVASMRLPATVIVPFGPSGAAMPGEEDHHKVILAFRQIHLIEGKRPDLLAFGESTWASTGTAETDRARTWPERLLDERDHEIVRQGRFAIEVKNSTWHYGQRRKFGGGRGPLSITVKEQELGALTNWSRRLGLPVLFVQVLFDEIYCMSYARMLAGIKRGYVYTDGDYKRDVESGAGGKVYRRFFVDGPPHLCGRVVFPDESVAQVRILEDGNVVPYIQPGFKGSLQHRLLGWTIDAR